MHFKIGHGHEERHRKESYVLFTPKKYSHFAQQNDKFSSLKKYFYQVFLTSSLLVGLNNWLG